MKKKEYLIGLLSLYMASPLVMANDFKPTFELNKVQLDYITAGTTEVDAGAAAAAQAAGMIAASFASTLTLTGATSESGGIAGAGAGAAAVGTDNASTGAVVATTANGLLPSHTFAGSTHVDGPLISQSGAVEISVVSTLPTLP